MVLCVLFIDLFAAMTFCNLEIIFDVNEGGVEKCLSKFFHWSVWIMKIIIH